MKTHRITVSPLREEQSDRLSDSTIALARGILTAALALTLWVGAPNPAHAQVLTGSGPHLPLAPIVTPFIGVGLTYTEIPSTTFTGTWNSSAAAPWVGTFTGTGPLPIGSRPSGVSTYNFSGLAGGVLPAGTYFGLDDVDQGGGAAEHLTLKAYDLLNAVITSPWLDSTFAIKSATFTNQMPGWDWNNISANAYTFDGGTVPGNPNVGLALLSNQAILRLEVFRDNSLSNFGLAAPAAAAVTTVTVTKVSNGGVGPFSFTGSNGFTDQAITTVTSGVGVLGATQTLTAAGVITTITESGPPAGYVLASIVCTGLGADGTATPNIGTGLVTLNAAATAAGAAIGCTFTNNLLPPPAAIPTLDEWALIMLAMLLLGTGWLQYRRRQ